jgi:hypothetical protein
MDMAEPAAVYPVKVISPTPKGEDVLGLACDAVCRTGTALESFGLSSRNSIEISLT